MQLNVHLCFSFPQVPLNESSFKSNQVLPKWWCSLTSACGPRCRIREKHPPVHRDVVHPPSGQARSSDKT